MSYAAIFLITTTNEKSIYTTFMKKPLAIFWDMDGTLTDSEPLWEEATYFLSELLGKRLTPEQRQLTVGSTFENTLRVCAAAAGVELREEDYPKYRALTFNKTRELFAERLEVFPGIQNLLTQLKGDGIPMLVTTNTVRHVADSAIDTVGRHFFVDTICGDEVTEGKPAPDMYLEAARRVGVDPADALVFEDSTTGMRAALAAGCHVIGLPEHDQVEIPEGAVGIDKLRGDKHLNGAKAADVYDWFARISG
jgi:HAD superfamily hydrolase (TIGR01509 family)